MKKKMIYGVCGLILVLLVVLTMSGSASRSEYDKKARKAAETFLKNEVDAHTWTTVKTGKLKYMITMYNEALDVYKVSYYTKFDAANEVEDEWVVIEVRLSGKSLGVESAEAIYYDVYSYESSLQKEQYKIISGQMDKDGTWIRVD